MFEFAALTYGVLVSFILSSVSSNRRQARRNSAMLNMFGWGIMSFSFAAALIIVSYLSYQALSGQATSLLA
ncbi:hypothetical protein [Sphingomonas nostoxanthinifaciens]|uniref:hypothetical protein n=1 Tax=Sphingomonas nostoxanthinifaciens TaxID=2872652 RepID=UPI001CC1E1EE|nr:hypothetical protein [Sphingomonas nostoxanthinifaciens]UAK23733.1 hypothetical protein K8P63_15300 [Sphingomonas nostoxanthinifaciens]